MHAFSWPSIHRSDWDRITGLGENFVSFHANRIAGFALVIMAAWSCAVERRANAEGTGGSTEFRLSGGSVPLAPVTPLGPAATTDGAPFASSYETFSSSTQMKAHGYGTYSSEIQAAEPVYESPYGPHEFDGSFGCGIEGDCGISSPMIAEGYPGASRGRLANGMERFFSDSAGACCNPRFFDVYAGFVVLDRDLGTDRVGFASDGIGANNIVLSTSDLALDTQPGLQLTLARVIRAGRTLEANYIGLVEWSANAAARSTNHNLYSAFSDFGTNPGPPTAGFLDTDQSALQNISYKSRLHSVDLVLRQRYTSSDCRLNLSKSAGLRFVSLDEDFSYGTNVEPHFDPFSDPNNPVIRGPASLNYDIDVENDLLGFQVGGSAEWCVNSRMRVGGEFRVGLYQNFAEQTTRIACTSCGDTVIQERSLVEEPSSVAELNAYTVYQITPRCKLRVGYYLLHLTQLVLAPDQFDASPAFVFPPPPAVPRTPTINNGADLFLSGLTTGLELMW